MLLTTGPDTKSPPNNHGFVEKKSGSISGSEVDPLFFGPLKSTHFMEGGTHFMEGGFEWGVSWRAGLSGGRV